MINILLILLILSIMILNNFLHAEKKQDSDSGLLAKAVLLRIQTAIQLYNAEKNEWCFKNLTNKNCDNGYPTTLEELIPKYINEIPKISISDKNWKGEGKNTYILDPTPQTSILPQDISETTTWIYNPKFGKVILNKIADFNIINFIENYIETADHSNNNNEKLKYYNEAMNYYNKNKKIEEVKQNKKILAEIYTKRGFTFFDLKEYKKAIIDFTNSMKLNKDNEPLITLGLGISYMETENNKDAEKMAQKLIELKPELKLNNVKYLHLYETFKYSFSKNQEISIKKFFKIYLSIKLD